MPSPPQPPGESRRLEVLREYGILDSAPEEAFDLLTEMASCLCQAPVAPASDGAEAVAIFGKLSDTIDVVLTDIMMPIMDGVAAIRALKHMDPTVKIIAASGLGSNGGVSRAADGGVKHFLPKPYTAETLLGVIFQVLNEDED